MSLLEVEPAEHDLRASIRHSKEIKPHGGIINTSRIDKTQMSTVATILYYVVQ